MFYLKLLVQILFLLSLSASTFAATRVSLSAQNMHLLVTMPLSNLMTASANSATVQEVKRTVDNKRHHLHIHLQQTYGGYPVWNANMIVHVPQMNRMMASASATTLMRQTNTSVNGVMYQQLGNDLQNIPERVFNEESAQQALNRMIKSYKDSHPNATITQTVSKLVVYVDPAAQAHWVYQVSFYVPSTQDNVVPAAPQYLVDAVSLHVYKAWDNVKTSEPLEQPVEGGGYGGNYSLGRLLYDGWRLPGHRTTLNVLRDWRMQCYLKNQYVTVLNANSKRIIKYHCPMPDPEHHNIYWNEGLEAANGGYSTGNDVMFAAQMVQEMYEKWYSVPLVVKTKNPTPLVVLVHLAAANAYWDGEAQRAYFGDGSLMMFPLTTIDVVGHEFSHGFTQQHSDLIYEGESGGMNEAFSDMAGVTLNYYVTNQVDWRIGAGINKHSKKPFRWMNTPHLDGYSIEHVDDYREDMNVHRTSGIYNKAFYLLATKPNWDVRKAFAVMLHANRYYWTNTSSFDEGACGVVSAAKELHYSVPDVQAAFLEVGIDATRC